jgi:type IV secretory pathway VirB3-like protein
VLFSTVEPLVKTFLLEACMSLFSILAEYFMYSHLPFFLHIVAMLCCSEDDEFFDEDFF